MNHARHHVSSPSPFRLVHPAGPCRLPLRCAPGALHLVLTVSRLCLRLLNLRALQVVSSKESVRPPYMENSWLRETERLQSSSREGIPCPEQRRFLWDPQTVSGSGVHPYLMCRGVRAEEEQSIGGTAHRGAWQQTTSRPGRTSGSGRMMGIRSALQVYSSVLPATHQMTVAPLRGFTASKHMTQQRTTSAYRWAGLSG